jgi:hypothetical protein
VAVSAADVKAILPTDGLAVGEDISWSIADATEIVTDVLGQAGLTATRIDLITKYLAAHFVTLKSEKGGLTRDRMGDADQSYVQNQDASGFMLTRYGQQALIMDPTGELSKMDATKEGQAEFRIV